MFLSRGRQEPRSYPRKLSVHRAVPQNCVPKSRVKQILVLIPDPGLLNFESGSRTPGFPNFKISPGYSSHPRIFGTWIAGSRMLTLDSISLCCEPWSSEVHCGARRLSASIQKHLAPRVSIFHSGKHSVLVESSKYVYYAEAASNFKKVKF